MPDRTVEDRQLLRDARDGAARLLTSLSGQLGNLERCAGPLAADRAEAGRLVLVRAIDAARQTVEDIDKALGVTADNAS